MSGQKSIGMLVFLMALTSGFSQPYIDVASLNYQRFWADYKNISASNTTDSYTFNLLLPKRLKNGGVLLCRINAERIHSQSEGLNGVSSNLTGIAMPLGYQTTSASQNWKTTLLVIPKIASDFERPLHESDWQYGVLFLEEYRFSDKLQLKFGLFANREAFGAFFVPLLGVDWKVSDRIYCYGVLPASYKLEYQAIRNKLYAGLQFKSQTHSFHISKASDDQYVRFDEVVVKAFADWMVFKNVAANAEVGYSLGKSPLQYESGSHRESRANPLYTPLDPFPIFAVGLAYRIRN